jgi:M6 family metalloprotease-like protein
MIRTILTAFIILLLPLTSVAGIPHRGEGCWRTIPKKRQALTRALLSEKKDNIKRVKFQGHFRGLVILAEFSDKTFKETNDRQRYDDILNAPGYTSSEGFRGSVADYFRDQSAGLFELKFDVVGPYTAEKSSRFYGQNDDSGNDRHPAELIAEMCKAADKEVNFADYDWDGDGEVEEVFVVYAGKSESDAGDSNLLYPHMWTLEEAGVGSLELDGVKVDVYACANELKNSNRINGIGTFCHEFSHCLGLPDFYDLLYTGGFGMGYFDLMSAGNYNGNGYCPAGYTAFEKMVCGWVEPIELSDQDVTVESLKPMSENGDTYIIYNDGYPNEFYMIENRQKTGWDSNYPSQGLLITHVDYDQEIWENNCPNTIIDMKKAIEWGLSFTNDHERMTMFHADNSSSMSSTKNDLYPYKQADSLTATSNPAATLYHHNSLRKKIMQGAILDIKQNADNTMSFRYRATASKATAIREQELPTVPCMIYTLDGRPVGSDISSLPHGIYVVDGKKVVR